MGKIEAVKRGDLSDGPSTPGIVRRIAFQSEGATVIRAQTDPGMVSGWHTHTDHDIYGYVAAGRARFEFEADEQGTIDLGPGDFFHVPPRTPHRESNPSDEASQILLFITGDGPLVENLDGPQAG